MFFDTDRHLHKHTYSPRHSINDMSKKCMYSSIGKQSKHGEKLKVHLKGT